MNQGSIVLVQVEVLRIFKKKELNNTTLFLFVKNPQNLYLQVYNTTLIPVDHNNLEKYNA